MSDAELREKIAEVVREAASCPRLCDWLAPERCACGHDADAILALVHPAIQAARVEALREAKEIARQHEAKETERRSHVKAFTAWQIGVSIHYLIEKETAP